MPSMWTWSSTLGRSRMNGDIPRPFMMVESGFRGQVLWREVFDYCDDAVVVIESAKGWSCQRRPEVEQILH